MITPVLSGYRAAGEAVLLNGYLVATTVSMPLWLMKGQPRSAQILMTGVPTLILIACALLNAGD